MKPIIRVENLSKQYTIGTRQAAYGTLRDSLTGWLRNPFARNGNREDNTIWALRDVSFDVMPGEVVGIIGRNGAGKSTLLKILSRIVEPTTGKVDLYGRVGSLLEVGTGFHSELSGRENIYLNGAILGMKRTEIDRKFDEIVDFAEIERFIDTPVKHYSSGMYMRLAFAVAAHLEPEILIVDEVLAVGDAEFQKKCLGKMGEVANQGKTVLFVSHNLQAVKSLCHSAIYLKNGEIDKTGKVDEVVNNYLAVPTLLSNEKIWSINDLPGDESIKLVRISILSECGKKYEVYSTNKDLIVEVEVDVTKWVADLCVGFDLVTSIGASVFRTYQTDSDTVSSLKNGRQVLRCVIPSKLLNAEVYKVCPRIGLHNVRWIVNMDPVVSFEVILDHGISPFWNSIVRGTRPGVIAPILKWSIAES